jgi:Tim10/DDP family zinc finger
MSWWSGGSKGSDSDSQSAKDFTSDDATSAGYGAAENILNSGATAASDGMMELQQAGLVLQQQLLVQQVISDLTDRSYEKCVTSKPNDTLSGSQVACIKATVNKWLDTNEFLTGRLAKKQQMAQQHQAQY